MSRRKRDARPAASVPAAEATAAATPVDGRFRRRLLIAAAVTAAWWAALIGMVAFTADPVTINRRQLRKSSRIITAEIVDAAEGRVKIVKDYSDGGRSGELRVKGLGELGLRDGTTYILPLKWVAARKQDGPSPQSKPRTAETAEGYWRITPPDAPHGPVVYPATDDTLRQLEKFLDTVKGVPR